jgi:hypothetical protein
MTETLGLHPILRSSNLSRFIDFNRERSEDRESLPG